MADFSPLPPSLPPSLLPDLGIVAGVDDEAHHPIGVADGAAAEEDGSGLNRLEWEEGREGGREGGREEM